MSKSRGDLQLAIGYWIVSHREQLRKWWVLALLGFIGLSLMWMIAFFSYFFGSQPATEAAIDRTGLAISGLRLPPAALPVNLTSTPVTVISRSATTVDLVATVTNSNSGWGGSTLAYHFTLGGESLPGATTFINPGETRPIIQLNQRVSSGSPVATLVIDDVTWERTSSAALPTPGFSVSEVQLTPTTVTIAGQTVTTYNLRATVTNRSVFNFLRVQVPMLLTVGEKIVAAEQIAIDRWPTLTNKTINQTWSYPVSQATGATIQPLVSQFDPTNLYR